MTDSETASGHVRRAPVSRIFRASKWTRIFVSTVLIWPPAFLAIRSTDLTPSDRAAAVGAFFAAMLVGILAAGIWEMSLDYLDGRQLTREERNQVKALRIQAEVARNKVAEKRTETLQAVGLFILVIGALVCGAGYLIAKGREWVVDWQTSRELEACRENLHSDLVEFLGLARDPTVTKCVGKPEKATCFVQSLQDGKYKIEPMVGDFSKRYLRSGVRDAAKNSQESRQQFESQRRAFLEAVRRGE